MKINQVDKGKLSRLVDELTRAIEDVLTTGLTTASDSTRQVLNVSFQESSRMGLLRLGGTLRIVCEELSRYTSKNADFSKQRFLFFLNRAWLISRGLALALKLNDEAAFERLSWTPSSAPVSRLELICLGVSKKVVPNAFCAFDFRFRVLGTASGDLAAGTNLVWSFVSPMKAGSEVPAEAYLQLPQKQKFKAIELMQGKVITVTDAGISFDKGTAGRLTFLENTSLQVGKKFDQWVDYVSDWHPDDALHRLRSHTPGPLDLDVEMQEEIILPDWQIEPPVDEGSRDAARTYSIVYKDLIFQAVVPKGVDGEVLEENLQKQLKAKTLPPLVAMLHYERCRLTLQPVSLLTADGPQHLNVSSKNINTAALLKTLKF